MISLWPRNEPDYFHAYDPEKFKLCISVNDCVYHYSQFLSGAGTSPEEQLFRIARHLTEEL